MTEFGATLIIDGDVKYIGEGEDPADDPLMKSYARALKEVYQPERSKREDLKKCIVCECEYPKEQVPNSVCDNCSDDSTYADNL